MDRGSRIAAAAAAVALAASGCGGSEGQLEPRFVALHNAMQAMGMSRLGAISEGSLPEGAEARIETELAGGECYTFVALGDERVEDVDLRIVSESGEEIGRDTTYDRHAAAQVCPEDGASYQIVVRMASGQGGYAVTSWSGGSAGGAVARGGARGPGVAGNCDDPIPLELGRPVQGNTQSARNAMSGSCFNGDAPEQVYRVSVDERVQLSAVVQSAFDGAVYVLRTCGQPQSELACNDDSPDTSRSAVDVTLDPGEYFVVVDGYGSESGTYELIASVSPLQSLEAVCDSATALAVGQPVSGATTGSANYFQATCAGGAASPDRVYYLDVPSRSRVRVSQQSDHDGALYMRRSCADPNTEIACNDDHVDQQHSLVTAIAEPGRYYVFSDGFQNGNAGNFTLTAELTSDAGGGATGDTCAAVATLAAGQPTQLDTFEARDEYAGSCGGQGGPDVVYQIGVRQRSRLRVQVGQPQFTGTVYVRSNCTDATTEVACVEVAQSNGGTVDTVVQPGTYSIIVDGARPDAFGTAQIEAQVDDLAALERSCRAAPLIQPGRVISGDTSQSSDRFQATCAGNARSNDVVYRLRIRRRSMVRVNMQSDFDGALHLRSDCTDPTAEIACNDDHNDNRHSFVEQTLDPGLYYVIVDGFSTGNQGSFTIDVDVSNAP